MGKFISGLPANNNLNKWASYAKQNSFDQRKSKAQSKRDLAPAGRGDREDDWSDKWQVPQAKSEGRGRHEAYRC